MYQEPHNTNLLLGWPTSYSDNSINQKEKRPFIRKDRKNDLTYLKSYDEDGHLVTFAPTGSGKGVSVIIPNLLHYNGPTIVIDPKGENFAITADYRQSVLNQNIILLDPFKAVPEELLVQYDVKRSKLNPLSLANIKDASIDNDAQMIADLFSDGGVSLDEPFWDTAAKALLSGVIAYEMCESVKENRTPNFEKIIDLLYSDDVVYSMAVILDTKKPTQFIYRTFSAFLQLANETRTGILITAQSYLSILITGDILHFLSDSTFDLELIRSNQNYTIYIVIPPNKLQSHRFLLKIWVGVLMHTIMERKELPDKRTLFVLDECANLGELDILRKAVTLLRGYGLQVWMFFQDVSQMQELYGGDFFTMINNCAIVQTFGISRQSSASRLSKILGKYSSTELLKLDRSEQVISISPAKVEIYRLMKYYKDSIFKGKFKKNPLIRYKSPKNKISFLKERQINLRF